jgi:hypothetical protein
MGTHGTERASTRYSGDEWNRSQVRQFVSKAARCKARAAFELSAPLSLTLPATCFDLSFARPLRAAGGTAGRVKSTHRTDGAPYIDPHSASIASPLALICG